MFIYAGAAVIGLVLTIFWRPLLSTTVNEDLAAVDGINIDLMRLILMLLVGIVIAVGMKFVDIGLAVDMVQVLDYIDFDSVLNLRFSWD